MHAVNLDGLSPAQVQVAAALAAGSSISKAAALTNTGRTTIYTWIKTNPNFAKLVRSATVERAEILRDKLHDQAMDAIETVAAIMRDEKASCSARLHAALAILNRHAWNLPIAPADAEGQFPAATEPPSAPFAQNGTVRNTSEQKTQNFPVPPPQPARSAPYACGSGQKYKRCCGRAAPPHLQAAA